MQPEHKEIVDAVEEIISVVKAAKARPRAIQWNNVLIAAHCIKQQVHALIAENENLRKGSKP